MPKNSYLPVLGLCATYLLQTSFAYLLCVAIDRLLLQARFRCVLWISFLIGTAAYWLFLVATLAIPSHEASAPAMPTGAPPGLRMPSLINWSVPADWSGTIDLLFHLLLWTYAAGVLLSLARRIERRVRLRLLLRRAIPASVEISRVLSGLSRQLGLEQCRALALPELMSPATAYTRRPLILVPEFFELYLNETQLRDVLCHELVHVKRHDFFWHSLIDVTNCLVCFHPAVWLSMQHLQKVRELACDAEVVQVHGGNRLHYAECLTRLARLRVMAAAPNSLALDFAKSTSLLSLRVRTLVAPLPERSLTRYALSFGLTATLLIAFAALSPSLGIVLSFASALRPTSVASSFARQTEAQPIRKSHHVQQKRAVLKPRLVEDHGPSTPPPIGSVAATNLAAGPVLLQTVRAQVPVLRQDPPESATIRFEQASSDEPPMAKKKPRHHVSIPWAKIGVVAATAAIAVGAIEASSGESPQ